MAEGTESGNAPAKVRKPRSVVANKKPSAPTTPLALAKPTTSNGSANATLQGTVEKKFSKISLVDKAGKPIAIIHSTNPADKALSPGLSTILFMYALIDATLAGQGAGPDGSAMYVVDNWQKFQAHWGAHVSTHKLICEPAGRAGAQGYIGTLDQFVSVARAKAELVRQSIKEYGAARPHQRTKAEKTEVVEVRL